MFDPQSVGMAPMPEERRVTVVIDRAQQIELLGQGPVGVKFAVFGAPTVIGPLISTKMLILLAARSDKFIMIKNTHIQS